MKYKWEKYNNSTNLISEGITCNLNPTFKILYNIDLYMLAKFAW